MGKRWDYDVPSEDVWRECLRVLKAGGHLLAFAGTRTQHRMAVRIEDAGFEIRDMIAWVYGSGFPKSLDVSKAIDKAAGAERGEEQPHPTNQCRGGQWCKCQTLDETGRYSPTKHPALTAPATPAARQWHGWGTALKPALEPITVARKPLIGTVAENVLTWGTGGVNVDGCRVGRDADDVSGWSQSGSKASENRAMSGANYAREAKPDGSGRWPANLIHDGSEEVVGLFPCEDSGSAARFFYEAKAGGDDDRHAGCSGLFWQGAENVAGWSPIDRSEWERRTIENERARKAHLPPLYRISRGSIHTTVKPTDLMRYLCRLVTPPGGVVLDPFTGSGSTGRGAILEGFWFIGIEREPEYVAIARARIEDAMGTRRSETAQGSLGL